jgi:hypothetical protein
MHRLLPLALVACGSPPKPNTMLGTPSRLALVGAPHLAVYVTGDRGLVRLYLDTGTTEVVNPALDATAITATTTVRIDNGHYVIEREGKRVVVDDLTATPGPAISPDGRWLAVAEAGPDVRVDDIAIVSVADGAVRRFPLEPPGPPPRPALSVQWAKASDAVLFDYAGRFRLDVGTGKIASIDKQDWQIASAAATTTECPARGLKLERRTQNHRQEIVAIALATSGDPEQLAAVEPRVLVSSTAYGRDSLDVALVTPSCDHFVFTLEGRIYVASVATGRYAFLMRGGRPSLPR